MVVNREPIEMLYRDLRPDTKEMLDRAIESIVSAKKKGGKGLKVGKLGFKGKIDADAKVKKGKATGKLKATGEVTGPKGKKKKGKIDVKKSVKLPKR